MNYWRSVLRELKRAVRLALLAVPMPFRLQPMLPGQAQSVDSLHPRCCRTEHFLES